MRTVLCGLAAVALLAGSVLTMATGQPPEGKDKKDKKGKGSAFVDRLMAYDKNKDGKLTREEVKDERLHRLIDMADAKKKGFVTRADLEAAGYTIRDGKAVKVRPNGHRPGRNPEGKRPQSAGTAAPRPQRGASGVRRPSRTSRAAAGRIGVHQFTEPLWGERWVQYYLPEPPSANRWWRNVRGRMVLSREARAYKQRIQNAALLVQCPKVAAPHPVRLRIVWHRGRKSGDLDKRIGIALDALQGIAYDNDSQIVAIDAERMESDSLGPRLIVLMRVAQDA